MHIRSFATVSVIVAVVLVACGGASSSPVSTSNATSGPRELTADEASGMTSAPDGWKPTGASVGFQPKKLDSGGCQPYSNGCNSCCNNGISGNFFVRADCTTGCAMGCGSQPCY